MTFRAKVYGPSVTGQFGVDIHEITGPADVRDVDGVLLIIKPATEGRPFNPDSGIPARRKATRGSQVAYPRGGWTKVIITDYVEEES